MRILRRDIERMSAGYTRNFTIYDEDDQARVVRQIIKELDIDDKSMTARQALSAISWAKNRSISPAAYANQTEYASDRTEKIARIYKIYEQRLQQSNALDFDDLLIKAVELLRQVAEVRAYYHERFRHVMIDEFQDTNGIQYELARLIAVGSEKVERGQSDQEAFWQDRSLCVVGDIDQRVYAWRGSDFNIILGFQHDFEGTKMIKLEQNYRSTQTILEAANTVIERNGNGSQDAQRDRRAGGGRQDSLLPVLRRRGRGFFRRREDTGAFAPLARRAVRRALSHQLPVAPV